ncbi:hypothetical protein [Vreelandella sp. EE22]
MLSLAWWFVSTLVLNSQWMAAQLSNIDGVEVRWQRATSQHPGQWEVENLTLRREDDALTVSIEAERATLSLSLLALLRGKLHIHALNAEGIRHFRVGDVALEAQGELNVTDAELGRETLSADALTLALTQGRLVRLSDGAILARDIQLSAQSSLEPISTAQAPRAPLSPALLEALSARLDASAQADAWDVFTPYLKALPWLSLTGSGSLETSLGLERGVLTEQSELTLSAPALRFGVDTQRLLNTPVEGDTAEHSATGNGQVRLGVEEGELRFSAALEDVTLADASPYATHTSLSLTATMPNQRLDLLEPPSDAALDLQGDVTRLDMLDRYASTRADHPLAFTGQGRLRVFAKAQDGELHQGDIHIEATDITTTYRDIRVQGDGVLIAEHSPDGPLDAQLTLSDATLTHQGRTLLANADITLRAESPAAATTLDNATAHLDWQNARLPNIAALSPYLNAALSNPQTVELVSGQARSHGTLTLTSHALSGELSLVGERWVTHWPRQERARTLTSDAQLRLIIPSASLDGTAFDLSGSRLSWQAVSDGAPGERLESTLVLREGRFQRRHGDTHGQFHLAGAVQHLGFLNAFLPQAHGLALAGSGELFAQGAFAGSELLAPTQLRVNANALEARFLDYEASGRGELTAEIASPDDASLSLSIPQFSLQRQQDDRPALLGRHLTLTTETGRFQEARQSPAPDYFTTRIALPIVEVPDITRYNDYLPDTDGLALLGGQASLESEWRLAGWQARGAVTLRAFGAELALLEQRLRGDIVLHMALDEGDLETRRFRADDSFVQLENVFRLSEQGAQDAGWWVRLSMTDAALTWREPISLQSTLRLSMRDTGLLARLFLERAREHAWLGRLLDVRHIEGEADLEMNGERIHLRGLNLTGGPLLVLSDITLDQQSVSGALYARLGALGLGVELIESEPDLRLLRPRRWFDRWRQANRYPRP